jgi:hypothetical protein
LDRYKVDSRITRTAFVDACDKSDIPHSACQCLYERIVIYANDRPTNTGRAPVNDADYDIAKHTCQMEEAASGEDAFDRRYRF